jgi:ParB family transcriptional regulator, chromosome partitioning protein
MPISRDSDATAEVVPSGELIHLKTSDIIPSRNNPRHLFDRDPLDALKKNIRVHGVLVPLTVYRPKGQKRYSILDGERRYHCCLELENEGKSLSIPANVVASPTKVSGLLYMFSIHNFREQWELMPTALGLRSVMETLEVNDNQTLTRLTGLSEPQIERCKKLLAYDDKYQQLSLEPDPKKRIPSNFWIELYPVLNLCEEHLPNLVKEYTSDGIIEALIEKYRLKRIKSVIHFRRIMEAFEVAVDRKEVVLSRLETYIREISLETREAFDEFVVDNRRVAGAIEACETFVTSLDRLKLNYTLDRDELRAALERVAAHARSILSKLEGTDAPQSEIQENE